MFLTLEFVHEILLRVMQINVVLTFESVVESLKYMYGMSMSQMKVINQLQCMLYSESI